MQVNVGVSDMCDAWYGEYGDCAAHTPSPWLDNVRVYRYETIGPSFAWRDLDIFQDTFPQDVLGSPDPVTHRRPAVRERGVRDRPPGPDQPVPNPFREPEVGVTVVVDVPDLRPS